jgi:molybdopterin-guanine dinucleotide biosynthesis protein A
MGRDKSTMQVDGTALAVRTTDVLRAAGCAPVVAVGGDESALRALGLEVVADIWPGEGPLGGVLTALRHLGERGADAVVIVACDLVEIDVPSVGGLIAAWHSGGAVDAVVATSGRLQPLCAVWAARCTPNVERRFVAGTRAVRDALADLVVLPVEVAPRAMRNVNTPSDLAGGGER